MSAAALAPVLIEAIKVIAEVIADVKEKRNAGLIEAASDALTVIGAIVETVNKDDIDVEMAKEEIKHLRASLTVNDAAADWALRDKFKEK